MERYIIRVINESGNMRYLSHNKSHIVALENPFMCPVLFKSIEEAERGSDFYLKHLSFNPTKVDIMKVSMVLAGDKKPHVEEFK